MREVLATASVAADEDLVAVRQLAREIAAAVGFDAHGRTRIATALSEIVRNALAYAGGGRVEFALADEADGQHLALSVADDGPGIEDPDEIMVGAGRRAGGRALGIAATRRLMDAFEIDTAPGRGTRVRFGKRLPAGRRLSTGEIAALAARFARNRGASPMREMQEQNRELLAHLSELRSREEEIAAINAELENTNRGVVALYAELDDRAEQLRQASELKSRFLSHISHEFRTPLNSMLAISRLLLDRVDGPLTPEQERQVVYIRTSAQQLRELVDDLLDLAKVEAGKVDLRIARFPITSLIATLRGVLKPLQTTERVRLVFVEADGLPPMVSDEGKVSQILRNLVSNALKYTEAGEVRVDVCYDAQADSVAFAVSDTGIGIAPEDQDRIFQDFVQVEHALQLRVRGTGLGLPLSRRLAGLLGGDLTVDSRPGVGSTFTLTLPRIVGAPEVASTTGKVDGRPVLVIEDDEPARYVFRQLLSGRAAAVIEAIGGTEGLRRARADNPALIFLDLRLPDMNGFEVIRHLAEDPTTTGIPVVVCTASALDGAERTALSHARTVVSKAELSQELIEQLLGRLIVAETPPP
ncbi:MAG: ATP-binding protein [Alphaproteobacteria bacterium]